MYDYYSGKFSRNPRCRNLGFLHLIGIIAEEGDGIRVHIVARRRTRRGHVALGKHAGEAPGVLHFLSPRPLPSGEEWWWDPFLDFEALEMICLREWRVGWSWELER